MMEKLTTGAITPSPDDHQRVGYHRAAINTASQSANLVRGCRHLLDLRCGNDVLLDRDFHSSYVEAVLNRRHQHEVYPWKLNPHHQHRPDQPY